MVFRTIQNDALENVIFGLSNRHDEGLGRALSLRVGRGMSRLLGCALLANCLHGFVPGAIEGALDVHVVATLNKQLDVSPHVCFVGTFIEASIQPQQAVPTKCMDVLLALSIVDELPVKVSSKKMFIGCCWHIVNLIRLQQYSTWRLQQGRYNVGPPR